MKRTKGFILIAMLMISMFVFLFSGFKIRSGGFHSSHSFSSKASGLFHSSKSTVSKASGLFHSSKSYKSSSGTKSNSATKKVSQGLRTIILGGGSTRTYSSGFHFYPSGFRFFFIPYIPFNLIAVILIIAFIYWMIRKRRR
jgi:hypothetical protein